jgi:hypothetical protein
VFINSDVHPSESVYVYAIGVNEAFDIKSEYGE